MDHDVPVGFLKHCQITGSKDLHPIIDLGMQPPCDTLVDFPGQKEAKYPLGLMLCPQSGLAQLSYVVDGREIYHPDYPYRSGISKPLEEYQRAFANRIVERFDLVSDDLVVDVGSNDGTLLTGFKRHGCQVLGVEPTNVAEIARRENGIETLQEFFNESVARSIAGADGRAKVITMTNVFAHMATLGQVMRGLCSLLDDNGVFITESHYLLDVLEKTQFDTIYHEHIRTYSLKSLCALFPQYGMQVFDVSRADRYGGNIRAYVGWKGKHPVSVEVARLLKLEEERGLDRPETWVSFASKVERSKRAMVSFLNKAKWQGKKVVGVSAPGRCATLLNYYGVTPAHLPYLGELHNSLKLGKYQPGTQIPIVNNKRIIEEQPDAVVLMAWHYADPIVKRLREEGFKGEIYAPLPEWTCVSAS